MKLFSAVWAMNPYLTFQIRHTATYGYIEIHTYIRKFPKHLFWGLKYMSITSYGGINPYGDKKANCQVSDYKA